jgi:CBS domain containing-hemolysin-like protein
LSVTASHRYGLLTSAQQELLHRALDLDAVTVREVMVPRPDIFSLPAEMPLEEAAAKVVEEQHSRIPVYDAARGPEAIVGVLYAKDLMRWMHYRLRRTGNEPQPSPLLRDIMHDALLVPETKPLTDLLEEFQHRRRHMAVVVDEFGSTVGVVSVEDVLEQLVGEMEDEFDVAQPASRGEADSLLLEASLNLRDLETQYSLCLPRDEGFETLAGFVLAQLQRIPRVGDSFLYGQRRYTVVEMEGHRVGSVRVELLPAAGATAVTAGSRV